ncbi:MULTISPECIES: alpha-ketoglutarate-dependent dioxygenase AlkB [Bradyrhizobium]|uniref:alpha-ketoglutarate-dependent dioxygenase AlkB n=1 Tax=Bradyrhizobium TaxID=374 RepID=UPI002A101147|nr:alkylated DNA repair dioxygenase AlkB [Bradyrhizobium elkanii]MCS3560452.1 alkylated DNA repair dioxygenase AlkB [Bradyrhizobium elkanii]MCW2149705.1 alkylated DNA repair dioxygenase AlkB [Bradyrhizobium elkanii]MCW2360328.1 alkylated DNA repair dioxygenase AlkB [Bradyrhizobium elkanii]MCW2373434.1 alkylated DNA repair dioxygenase AlkB [Bradyrhizobium elkanii]
MSEQLSMFDAPAAGPAGLHYAPDFISKATEGELIRHIRALPLAPFQFGQFEGKRRVGSFGYRYDYGSRRLECAEPIPSWLNGIVAAIQSFGGASTEIGQILCTEYDRGVGIGWHRDKPHFDRIFGLSLGSACKFRFRRRTENGWERFTLDVAPRSLYLMGGDARQMWEHSIPPVEAPRYSITFRTMVGTARGAKAAR